ncbi:MAG: sulfite exporter TauE/SafE family protein [Firmicutes bacterium]|nr:sulfite exporter TauE/SafE family protein [Bacillota bacterium]
MDFLLQRLAGIDASGAIYLLVLAGGTATALTPCFIPILVMFSGYVGSYGGKTGVSGGGAWGLGLAASFTAGSALTLAMLGAAAAMAGGALLAAFTGLELDRWIPGALGTVMGLHLLGVLRLRLPMLGGRRRDSRKPRGMMDAFLLGIPFGLVITPCSVPIFAMVMAFAALKQSPLQGAALMAVFALGRGLVLAAVAWSAGLVQKWAMAAGGRWVEKAGGAVLLLAGLYMLLGPALAGLL